ncbi:MAG: cyclic nucleotide-binding domain-containing protein [Pseudomonadota bacterium]
MHIFDPDSLVLAAFVVGLISALSLPLGALTSFVWHLESRVIAAMMAFGGGALLAALTIDLVAPVLVQGHFEALFLGCLAGGLLFIVLNLLVNDFGGFRRKISTSVHHSRRETQRRLKRILTQLNRTQIFSGISDEAFRRLAEDVEPRFYAQGSYIYRDGDPSDALHVVVKGEVELRDDRASGDAGTEVVDRVHAGGAFGAYALFTGSPHDLAAAAVQPTWGWRIPEASLRRLLGESDDFRQTMKEWLKDPHIPVYLTTRQGMNGTEAGDWLREANRTLDEEGRLPDAKPVDRHAQAFRAIAGRLDRLPWLEDLSEEEAVWLSLHLVYRRHEPGDLLFREGDPPDHLFILEDGGITLSDTDRREQLPSRHDAGDGVGGRSFITGLRHTVTARAFGHCGVWALRRDDFQRLLAHYPDFRNRLAGYLRSPMIAAYLRQRYHLDGGTIEDWLQRALKAVKAGQSPPSLLSQGVESREPKGASVAIWLGILLDGVPESLVIGASLTPAGISLSLVGGLFLANYPEALSSSLGMREEKFSRMRILFMWTSIMLLTGMGAALGKSLIGAADPALFPFLQGFAAGAMLTMIAQTMLPEAYIKGGTIVGFSTLMGFLCAIFMKTLQ